MALGLLAARGPILAQTIRVGVHGSALVGVAEAAELLGLPRRAVSDRARRPDFPEPVARLACGPVWRLEQIHEYALSRCARYEERPGVERLAQAVADIRSPQGASGSPRGSSATAARPDGEWLTLPRAAAVLGVRDGHLLAQLVLRVLPPQAVRDEDGRVYVGAAWLGLLARELGGKAVERAS